MSGTLLSELAAITKCLRGPQLLSQKFNINLKLFNKFITTITLLVTITFITTNVTLLVCFHGHEILLDLHLTLQPEGPLV